jgi:rhodanese-related sulfurtransferase
MTQELIVYVCATPQKAAQAEAALTLKGYSAAQITDEEVTTFIYDASKYGGGGKNESLAGQIIVIGRK